MKWGCTNAQAAAALKVRASIAVRDFHQHTVSL